MHFVIKPKRPAVRRAVESLEPRRLLSAVTWTGGGDGTSWTDPANWSGGVVPGPGDDASIDVPGDITVRITSGDQAVNSVNSTDTIAVTGGSLTVAAASQVAALDVAGPGSVTIGGTFTTGNVTLGDGGPTINVVAASSGPATLVLTGTVSFTGTDGTAVISATAEANAGVVDLGGAARTFNVNDGAAAVDLSIAAQIVNGSLVKTGGGTMTLAGNSGNTYTGATQVEGGTLLLSKANGVAVPGDLLIDGASTVRSLAPQQLAQTTRITFDATGGSPTLDLGDNSHVLDALNSMQSGAGAVLFGRSALTVSSGTFSGTLTGSGTFIKDGPRALSAGTISGGAALNIDGGTMTVVDGSVSALSIAAGAALSVGDSLTIAYGDFVDPVSTIRGYLTSGYDAGKWDGSGIVPTSAPAVGYADGADGVAPGLDSHSILVRSTLPGDANLDGHVDFSDLLLLAQHYGVTTSASWDQGDFNYDGSVDFTDLLTLAQNYGRMLSALALRPS